MNQSNKQDATELHPGTASRPYATIFSFVALVWLVAFAIVFAIAWSVAPDRLMGLDILGVLIVSVASGLIAALAIAPGLLVIVAASETNRTDLGSRGDEIGGPERGELSQGGMIERIGAAFFAGMLIRLTGTVALFLMTSYYLVPPDGPLQSRLATLDTRVAIWVLGWHLVLLLAEVVSLARVLKPPRSEAIAATN